MSGRLARLFSNIQPLFLLLFAKADDRMSEYNSCFLIRNVAILFHKQHIRFGALVLSDVIVGPYDGGEF